MRGWSHSHYLLKTSSEGHKVLTAGGGHRHARSQSGSITTKVDLVVNRRPGIHNRIIDVHSDRVTCPKSKVNAASDDAKGWTQG